MAGQLILRIDPRLKTEVDRLARSEGKSTSQVVRDLIEQYVRSRDMGAYVNDLWGRIGRKLEARGVRSEDVERAIKNTRNPK